MILSAATLRKLKPVTPFVERGVIRGRSFGVSHNGYDIRVAESFTLLAGKFTLASSFEFFSMPSDVIAFVHDKSSLLRLGLTVGNSVIESAWRGYLTLELFNNSEQALVFETGDAIAQVIFHRTEEPAFYEGKYQDQPQGITPALFES